MPFSTPQQALQCPKLHSQCVLYLQGMGEPLNNYSQVRAAVSMMTDPQAFALRRSAVTVSTVGVIPRMLQMIDDLPGISLALSLHAPTQELRKTIVPSAKAYPLDRLMAAVDKYQMQTRQKVSLLCQMPLLLLGHASASSAVAIILTATGLLNSFTGQFIWQFSHN